MSNFHNCNGRVRKIGVLCPYSFPEGMAPTTRIIAYCKGLLQNGVKTEVFSFERFTDEKGKERKGLVEGVPYTIPYCYRQNLYHSKLYRIFIGNPLLIFYVVKSILKSNKYENFDFIFISFDSIREMFIYAIILRCFRIRLAFIGDEYPEAIRQLKDRIPSYQIQLYKWVYKLIDVRILMTDALKQFYDSNISIKPTYILSSIIDEKRFTDIQKQHTEREYLCYMGNLMLAKDNVDNIVSAFNLIKDRFKYIDLYLYGCPNKEDKKFISELIEKNNLSERVFLMGRANYNDVPQILANAKILVTSQPLTKRAEGGFPTKLGEYMLSGVPTLLTDVGEIKKYVTDGLNVYMVEPCNPVSYAEKLCYILENYSDALSVAGNAKFYIENNFIAKKATEGLVDFLSQYKKN